MAATVDCYKMLGLQKGASKDEIRKAYKKLSKQYHPDVNAGDSEALQKFKDVQRAWEILGDDEKRRNYDQYGSPDGPRFTADRGRPSAAGSAEGNQESWSWSTGGDDVPFDIEELLSGVRGRTTGGRGTERRTWPIPGQDARTKISIPFMLAAEGGRTELQLQRGAATVPETLTVTIPAGIDSGSVIRLTGEGSPGINGGPNGDLLVSITVAAHPWFRRDGANVLLDLPISLTECALGAKVEIPTLRDGTVTVTVPPGTSSGAKLRFKGKGIRDRRTGQLGDQLAVVKIVAPRDPDDRSVELLNELDGTLQQSPRTGLWSNFAK